MNIRHFKWASLAGGVVAVLGILAAQDAQRASSYAPVDIHETFAAIMTRMTAAKPEIMRRQLALLDQRYDLSDRPAQGTAMSKGKPCRRACGLNCPAAPRGISLPSWSGPNQGARSVPGRISTAAASEPWRGRDALSKFEIDEIKKDEERDLTRFDLDFDIPDRFLPEFPAPIYLTTRPDLGDVVRRQARDHRELL